MNNSDDASGGHRAGDAQTTPAPARIIATVYRSGGEYDVKYVQALWRGVQQHAPEHEFRVLSDVDEVATDLLEHDWPGWWAKFALFRPGLFDGPVLYMDLDTLPVGDLSDLCGYDGPFCVLRDFYAKDPKMVGSGVMAWTPGEHTERIYRAFKAAPGFSGRMDYVLRELLPANTDRFQDLYPDQIVSLKPLSGPRPIEHGPPDGARLVCGHGHPRLANAAAGWGYHLWKRRTGAPHE